MNPIARTLLAGLLLAGLSPALAPAAEPDPAAAPESAQPAAEATTAEQPAAEQPPVELDEPFVDPLANLNQNPAPDAATIDLPVLDRLELRWGGRIQTDVRVRPTGKSAGLFYDSRDFTYYRRDDLPAGIARNENYFKLKLDAVYGRFSGAVDIDFVWLGVPDDIDGVGDLSLRQRIAPYYLQTNALFVEARDLFVDGLDLRVGQQLVEWGKADQFNPTNNINPMDLEDILLFGEQMANLMVRADYNPVSSLVLSGVLVPVFEPAQVPRSAPLALAASDRAPFGPNALRYKIHAEQAFTLDQGYPTVVNRVQPDLPATSLENMQYAFRLAFSVLGQDLAFSYYNGRHDFPQPVANDTYQQQQPYCDRAAPEDCIAGLLQTEVRLIYPRMKVAGLNMAGEIPLDWIADSLGGIGYRLELGVYFPQRVRMSLVQHQVELMGFTEDGEYDYDGDGEPGGPLPTVIDDTPFAKWTVGLDYSFGAHVMLNLMWVHGMADEFGAGDFFHQGYLVRQGGVGPRSPEERAAIDQCVIAERLAAMGLGEPPDPACGQRWAREVLRPRIGDYAVVGVDLKFADDRGLLRLFAMWDVSGYFVDAWDETQGRRVRRYLSLFGDGFSAIVYPEFNFNFGNGFELGAGALLQFGKGYTKFGEPAAGGHLVWTRARFSF